VKRGNLYPIVLELLMVHPNLRDDDNALEVAVCRRWNKQFDTMAAAEFVSLRDSLGFPSRESIGRIRRLIQENVEELAASEQCKRKRVEKEEEWKELVRGGKG